MADFVKREEFIEGKQFELKNVPVEWCYLAEPDTKFEHCWKLTARLEEPLAKSMKAAGFNIKLSSDMDRYKEGDDVYYFLEIKTKVKQKSGKENRPPYVCDREGNTMDGGIVGNGSRCIVRVFAQYKEVSGTLHLPAYLNGVQVLSLVKYNPNSFDAVDENGDKVAGADDMFPGA